MTLSEKRSLISALQQEYSVREICETLGFNRSSFYYHPQEDPSEDALRSEIRRLRDGIRDTGIGVSRSCYCVWDTPLAPDASHA